MCIARALLLVTKQNATNKRFHLTKLHIYRASWNFTNQLERTHTHQKTTLQKPRTPRPENQHRSTICPSIWLIFGAGRGEAAADELQNALLHSVVVSHRSFWRMNFSSQMEWQKFAISSCNAAPKSEQEEESHAWCLSKPLQCHIYTTTKTWCRSRGKKAGLLCKLKIF
jgi:hypothetical protein